MFEPVCIVIGRDLSYRIEHGARSCPPGFRQVEGRLPAQLVLVGFRQAASIRPEDAHLFGPMPFPMGDEPPDIRVFVEE